LKLITVSPTFAEISDQAKTKVFEAGMQSSNIEFLSNFATMGLQWPETDQRLLRRKTSISEVETKPSLKLAKNSDWRLEANAATSRAIILHYNNIIILFLQSGVIVVHTPKSTARKQFVSLSIQPWRASFCFSFLLTFTIPIDLYKEPIRPVN
jgi:hypothetical protein